MKTGYKILIATSAVLSATAVVVTLSEIKRARARQAEMLPLMEEIVRADVKVVCLERTNDNYVRVSFDKYGNNKGESLIRFPQSEVTPEMMRLEGDTLIITTDQRLVLQLPEGVEVVRR